MEKIILNVPAIHCDHCVHTIKIELGQVNGVEDVQIDGQNKVVNVSFSPPATVEEIRDLLIEINYPPEE